MTEMEYDGILQGTATNSKIVAIVLVVTGEICDI